MINKMAALGSYQIGNLLGNEIACTVAGDRVYKGNVSVFDSSLKAVVIENESDSQMHFINLQNIKQIEVIKAEPSQQDIRYTFHQIDYNKLKRRFDDAVEERKVQLMRIGDGVSSEAQHLFDKIATVYSDIRWDGHVIVVMGDVRISPPYQPDNCVGRSEEAVDRLRMMVTNFRAKKS